MHSLRQKARPKHQMLTLKCYPHYQKNAAEIKPNSSELSYLLYYANMRRTKLQKVGAFLEKKTAKDVSWNRTGDVQVTLQIVTALIEKVPRELPLYSTYILRIIQSALCSNDINLIEESVATFGAFCSHYDSVTLSADADHQRQYEGVIKLYSEFASGKFAKQYRGREIHVSIAIRLRTAGLHAIKSLVSSESFAMDNGRQIGVIMPSVLRNLQADRPNHLKLLRQRESAKEQSEKDPVARRRASMSVQRYKELNETDEEAPFGSTADADARANEGAGVLALQTLKQIFTANNRGQLRAATTAAVEFVISHGTILSSTQEAYQPSETTWYTTLFDMVCRWTPVQDRYIVIVTVMEFLIKSPIVEKDMGNQLILADIIGWLLRSDINCIGLSVMDVLIGLIQHILLLLQLGGPSSSVVPHRQQSVVLNNPFQTADKTEARLEDAQPPPTWTSPVVMEVVSTPSSPRLLLLEKLQRCIGDLAAHIYYSEQVGDMISALLLRLKPSPTSAVANPTSAVEDPVGAAEAIADSANLRESPHTSGFFSFETARCLALQAVKEIIVVANSRRKDGDKPSGRNRVRVDVWEGTQWLLRDPDGNVRRAYVDALLTWLHFELDKRDLRLIEESRTRAGRKDLDLSNGAGLAKRAISNASQRNRPHTKCGAFLQLLHLAVYENACQYALSEPDVLFLHLLLTRLVQKLGVNSVRCGLPMVFRLQETAAEQDSPAAHVALSSLCFGYLWTLSETFDFDATAAGQEIHKEIAARSQRGCWLKSIHVPPLSIEHINTPTESTPAQIGISEGIDTATMKPCDALQTIVDYIADAYSSAIISPPNSPPTSPSRTLSTSPSRTLSMPMISQTIEAREPKLLNRALPGKVKEEMLTPWTREACIATVEHERRKTTSLAGSKNGSGSGSRKYLSANGAHSPELVRSQQRPPSASPARNHSIASTRSPLSNTSVRSMVRVEDLKRALQGGVPASFLAAPHGGDALVDDTGSESMVTAPSSSGSESGSAALASITAPREQRSQTSTPPNFSRPVPQPSNRSTEQIADDDDVPPVPMLPANLRAPTLGSPFAAGIERQLQAVDASEQPPPSRGKESRYSGKESRYSGGFGYSRWAREPAVDTRLDLKTLLDGIDSSSLTQRPTPSMGAPPY